MCVHVRAHSSLFLCVCVMSVVWLHFSSRGEWQRTGVIGSSLSPQTGGTFHHRGISFQFSKPCHTSDAINKVFFQTRGGKMQVSSYLIIPLIALRRENKFPCAVRGKKTRLEYMSRRRQVQLSEATLIPPTPMDNTIQDTKPQHRTCRRLTNKVMPLKRGNLTAANVD